MLVDSYTVLHFAISFCTALCMKQGKPVDVHYGDLLYPALLCHLVDFVQAFPSVRALHANLDVCLLAIFFGSFVSRRYLDNVRVESSLQTFAICLLAHSACDQGLEALGMDPDNWLLLGLSVAIGLAVYGLLDFTPTTNHRIWLVGFVLALATHGYLVLLYRNWKTDRLNAVRIVASLAAVFQVLILECLARFCGLTIFSLKSTGPPTTKPSGRKHPGTSVTAEIPPDNVSDDGSPRSFTGPLTAETNSRTNEIRFTFVP